MSIVKVDKNKYRIFISDGFNLDRSRRRFTKTITTDLKGRDLKRFLTIQEMEFEKEVKKQDPKFLKLARGTFEAYSIWWLEYKKIEDKTRAGYQYLLNSRILPYIGDKILNKLTTGVMIELMQAIETTPSEKTKKLLSPKTVKHYHTLLVIMFNDAVSLKILPESPMNNVPVENPSTRVRRDNYYDFDDVKKLLEVLPTAPIRYQLATLLTLSTGLRLGELSAFQWKHIDLENCVVTVEQTNSYSLKESKIKDTAKNESSIREVAFPASLVPLFVEHRENELAKKELMGGDWHYGKDNPFKEDFVFTQANGKVIFVETISDWFRKFRRRQGLKEITFHGLRHTNATILVAGGINIRSISSRLGHAQTSTTVNLYTHALSSVDKESANIFDNIIKNNESGTESGTNDEEQKTRE